MFEEKYKMYVCILVIKKILLDYYFFILFDYYDLIIGFYLYEDMDWNRFWFDGYVCFCLWYII